MPTDEFRKRDGTCPKCGGQMRVHERGIHAWGDDIRWIVDDVDCEGGCELSRRDVAYSAS